MLLIISATNGQNLNLAKELQKIAKTQEKETDKENESSLY